MTQESLRRFCRKAAAEARARIPITVSQSKQFDRGYFLGLAHAYEMLVKHKLTAKKRHD